MSTVPRLGVCYDCVKARATTVVTGRWPVIPSLCYLEGGGGGRTVCGAVVRTRVKEAFQQFVESSGGTVSVARNAGGRQCQISGGCTGMLSRSRRDVALSA